MDKHTALVEIRNIINLFEMERKTIQGSYRAIECLKIANNALETSIKNEGKKKQKVLNTFDTLNIKVQKVFTIVKLHTGVTSEEILSTSRVQHLVIARQLAVYMCYKFINESPCILGSWFNRNHATIYHSIECVTNHLDYDKKFAELFKKIYVQVESNLIEVNN